MTKPPEKTGNNGKALGLKLIRDLEAILGLKGLSCEVFYRLGKIRQGLLPLLDRLYLKTFKRQDLLAECLEKTRILQGRLQRVSEALDGR